MARTRASVRAKVAFGKSSKARCSAAPSATSSPASGSSDRSSRSGTGGNPVHPRETPGWQKPITNFFISKDTNKNDQDSKEEDEEPIAGCSNIKRNIIESDSDTDEEVEKPKNTVLDETIELEPLDGEDSHKIEEYYPKNGVKGKGIGKKSKGKENESNNVEKRKREDEEPEVNKKPKI